MLEPDTRAALTEQLRPPSGFQLAHAVATTFTLDLTAALSIPLAFAAHRVRESRDPIAILDAVRRAADKIDVFAQAGQVFEPRASSDLFALLEPMIHPSRRLARTCFFTRRCGCWNTPAVMLAATGCSARAAISPMTEAGTLSSGSTEPALTAQPNRAHR